VAFGRHGSGRLRDQLRAGFPIPVGAGEDLAESARISDPLSSCPRCLVEAESINRSARPDSDSATSSAFLAGAEEAVP